MYMYMYMYMCMYMFMYIHKRYNYICHVHTYVDTKMLLVGFKQPVPIDDLKLVTVYQTIQISDAFVIL
jgi:hypothetical protein